MSTMTPGMQQMLFAREQGVAGPQDSLRYQRALHFPAHFASKLCVEHTYQGHNGCVNRLSWNADGSLLVSGSDDRRAIIWHYPEVDRPPLALTTEHRANIFGCQFLPCTGDRRIVTGAMDNSVQLHDLEASPAAAGAGAAAAAAAAAARAARQGSSGVRGAGSGGGHALHRRAASTNLQLVVPRTKVYLAHKDRVKDVKVEPLNPHNFWSAGEDGVVRQYDTRAPNQDTHESPTVLVQVRDGHKTIQVKSIDINKAHPHLMAVVGSDPYIRLYDRRRLGAGAWKPRGATPAVLALAPPHLPLAPHSWHGRTHATYVSFSNRGDKVVTTYHGDHAYSFDITATGELAALFPQPQLPPGRTRPAARTLPGPAWVLAAGSAAARGWPEAARGMRGTGRGDGGVGGGGGLDSSIRSSAFTAPLPPRAEEAKARGNAAVFERKWSAAVAAFTDGLYYAPGAPVLYALRADALLRRGWVGDAAMALRDCDTAVALDEACSRAFLARIQALQALQQYQCALTAAEEYRRRFPGRAVDELANLTSQLTASVEERRRLYEARRQQQERRRMQRTEALARAPRRAATSAARYTMAATAPAATATASGPAARSSSSPAAAAEAAATDGRRRSAPAKSSPSPATASAVVASAAAAAPVAATAAAAAAAAAATAAAAAAASSPADGRAREEPCAASPAANGRVRPIATTDPREPAAPCPAPLLRSCCEDEVQGPPPPPPPGSSPPQAVTVATAAGAVGVAGCEDESLGAGPQPQFIGPLLDSGIEVDGESSDAEDVDGQVAALADTSEGMDEDEDEDEEDEDEEQVEDEEEEGGARVVGDDVHEDAERRVGGGESDSGEDDSEEAESLGGELDGEEDPDLELFLQHYARSMDLAGSPNRPTGHQAAGPVDGAAACRRVPGAWGGSPGGRRLLQRYVGQCNVQTDIKEVAFIGSDDRLVAAGSDCGRVFLYDADTGGVLRALAADNDVANCVQCHPVLPVLATSGIENVIRLWSPRDSLPAAAAVPELQEELAAVVEHNQERMKEGNERPSALQEALQENPQLWHLLMNQLYGRGFMPGLSGRAGGGGGGEDDDDDDDSQPEVACRMA